MNSSITDNHYYYSKAFEKNQLENNCPQEELGDKRQQRTDQESKFLITNEISIKKIT